MKKVLLSLSLLAFIGSVTLFTSCDAIKDKVKEEADIDINLGIDGADATIEIPIITTTNLTTYPDTVSMPLNMSEELAVANAAITMQNIEKVTITEAKLVFNNCDAQNNASNFRTAMVVFYTNTNSEAKWIATNDEVPDVNSEEITLVPDASINLKDYLSTSTQVYYVSGVNMRRPTTKVLNATLKIKYHLDGNTGYGE
jgi:hypothetical protein